VNNRGRTAWRAVDVGRDDVIERTLNQLDALGIRQIAVTVGWQAAELRRAITESTRLSPALKRKIVYFENPSWGKPNGLSVQAARPFLTERTLLVMADQIAAPELVRDSVRDADGA